MTTAYGKNPIHELRAAQVLGEDLSPQELAELESWFEGDAALRDDLSFELAAAGLELTMSEPPEQMPASLRQKLSAQAKAFEASRSIGPAPSVPATLGKIESGRIVSEAPEVVVREVSLWRKRATFAWAAACIALFFGLFGWLRPTQQTPTGPVVVEASLDQQWQDFAQQYPDAKRGSWGEWELNGEGPEIPGVSGEVIWSEAAQTGLMRFEGLPTNDPNQAQYQLWIVDSRGLFDAQGQSARISGGVFNAKPQPTTDGGAVIVPIQPKLFVQGAAAFAVTIENPGGVWASDMSRRVTIALLGSG